MAELTPTPWHWVVHDGSMASIEGPGEMTDHVLSISPCKSCQGEEWIWGACTTPTKANADFIVNAANSRCDLIAALETALKVADEAREEWDRAPNGMKAGKLLIALSNPKLKYRADITAMHETLARVRALDVSGAPAEPAKAGAA